MFAALALTAMLAPVIGNPPSLPGSHGFCAAARVPKNRIDTEREYLAVIDRHIAALNGIMAKQPAPGDGAIQVGRVTRQTGPTFGAAAAAHFTAIGTNASQADTTADFLRKNAATRQKESAAFRAMTRAANRGTAIAARGSVRDVKAALDAVKAARAEIGGKK